MRKEFVAAIAEQAGIEQIDLVEKDIILHQILTDLAQNEFFSNNFVFKGGTCLTKCHMGYYRFSEDIDFTWKNQEKFETKSQKQIRKMLSNIINEIGNIFEAISSKRGLDFKYDKQNKRYVELGGSNRICTLKIWYSPQTVNIESFVKAQINFVEKIQFITQKGTLNALPCKKSKEIAFLFSEYEEYFQTINMYVYDTREILCEKVRAVLTRKGYKARDFLDIYLLCRKYNLKLENLLEPITDKIRFTLDSYQKYREHFEAKKTNVILGPFKWGREERLLLQEIEEKEFKEFLDSFQMFLKKVIEKISN